MTPVYQTVFGPAGNCYAACLASILGVPLADIPDWTDETWTEGVPTWLRERGWGCRFLGPGLPPAGLSIVTCRVVDGSLHAALCVDGCIVHDPSPRPFSTNPVPVFWTALRKEGA